MNGAVGNMSALVERPAKVKSPSWLCEPPHDGKPTPGELVKYKSYLHVQLERGVIPIERPAGKDMFAHHKNRSGNSDTFNVLRYVYAHPNVRTEDIAVALELPIKTARWVLRDLRTRGFAEVSRRVNHGAKERYSLWRLTDEGVRQTEQHVLR